MSKQHRLLLRQIKKAGIDETMQEKLADFFSSIDEAYKSFDNDLSHIETVLEKSSQELYQANQQLKNNVETISDQLSKVAGNIKEVIFEADLEGKWSYLNPAWEDLLGYSTEESLGRPYYDFINDLNGKPFDELSILQKSDFSATKIKVETLTAKNEKKWLDISVKRLNSKNGKPEGFIGTISDITAQKKVEFELIEAKEKATMASKAKDDFLSTMSHEIRTPLNAVIGVSNLLLLENPQKEQLENLHALKYSSEHLLELVNDILDFNKITSGSIELEETDFSLDRILNGLRSIFYHKAQNKGVRFTIKKDSALPSMLIGDSTRITQILSNLINNAIKFTEEGKVVVDIELEHENQDFAMIRFEVTDTGIGIPNEKQEKIFQSFAQADSNTTRKYGGTGLGLAICKKLVERMRGELWVESTEGKGSTFGFVLEFLKSKIEEDVQEEEFSADTFNMDDVESLNGVKILVAEDNHLNILVISKFLAKWDVIFEIAENGKKAVEKAEENCYDLILMDLQMPEMSGFEATKAIRNGNNPLNKTLPIYALSASAGIDIRNRIKECGLDGLICKPFNPKELYRTLSKIVHQGSPVG
ncbi:MULTISPECIES: PAS domain-containing hybrid sensor histidine kinase/response regulator [Flavobacteriaceae]|uniref:PAS domain-containing hybrid sensor histidine kinase/response regulator n=1 Tax=Flavobacteriaceae TaxID=49546 RepID=UPI0014912B3C|nr:MULTISPECIES: ATP-binding protein [Allomuricauda]MDC6364802.1 ATP-binding protein [Muricauda sp. AC10]